jgi:Type VI secretion system effector, Hcp
MHRVLHRRIPERPARTLRPPPARPEPNRSAGPAERLLSLQRSAGNNAVSRLLRSPSDLLRESEAVPLDDTATTTLNLEGVGTFPIESISTELRRGAPIGREKEKEPTKVAAWHITKRRDGYSQTLFKANLNGTTFPLAELTFKRASGQFVLRLRNAMITHFTFYSASGEEYESFTLEGDVDK